jgi:hypothetical protein
MDNSCFSTDTETDWEFLHNATDDDIDLSDIPEITEGQVDRAVVRVGGKPVLEGKEPTTKSKYESINWMLIEQLRRLSVAEKNEMAFAAADFALRQKRLILAKDHPDWPAERVDREARRLVFGV